MYNQNIKKNDTTQVINNLEKYYNKVDYIKELKKEKIKIKDEIILVEARNYDKEYIVYNYLEYWTDLRYVAIYSDQNFPYSEIKSIISEYGEILVERSLKLKKDELQGILYWENKRLNPAPTSKNLIVYFYNKRQDKLTDDLLFMKERLIQSNNKLIISIGENTRESLSYAALLLNPSNFDYFNNMNFDRFMKLGNSGKVMCAKLRDYLQRNVSNPLDMKRFLFFSSIILYLYGLRKPNDIDIIGYELPPAKGKTHNLFETFGSTGKNILNIGELSVKGYGNWQIGKSKEYLNNWFGYEWPNLIGATDMADMIFNPRYYLSLMGIKIITIKGDMERRKIRYRATSYADMIGYNFYLKDKILIEEPPYKYIVQGEERSYETKEEILLLLKKIKKYLKMRYNIRMNTQKLVTMLKIHINRWNPRRSRVKDK
jgi:hypothetical protein